MLDNDTDDSWSMFSLTENLTNSYVDQSKLLSYMSQNSNEIGMHNFRSKNKNKPTQPLSFQRNTSIATFGSLNSSGLSCSPAALRWRRAAMRVKFLNDPWVEFKIDALPTETAIRHRYNALKKEWVQDECTVKIESNQFAAGAMRACFRLKKLSNFVHKDSWDHASNYVAKSYMDPTIPRERYFDDVKLQMEAKLWAEIYNRHNPPKKIDMFQVSILEFKNRPDSPLFHLEHFIDGQYIKYNSNSGFVEDSHMRNTPQAFSHFTFECSNHDLIVVDIQGVGDLYTDPQIHTSKGTDYGEGNLGVKGFALFFSTHICNDVCKSLGLTPFDLAPSESKSQEKKYTNISKLGLTQMRGNEEMVIGSPSSFSEYTRRLRRRSSTSGCSDDYNGSVNDLPDIYESEGYESSSTSPQLSPNSFFSQNPMSSKPIPISTSAPKPIPMKHSFGHQRLRCESSCLDSGFSIDEAMNMFQAKRLGKLRPSCVNSQKDFIHRHNDSDDYMPSNGLDDEEEHESILGKVHLELCKYHEMGRFLTDENDQFDISAALFHLKQAADLGIDEAIVNLAKIYLQLPHDILSSYQVDETDENLRIGFDYMEQSADKGNKNSIYYLAKAYDTGLGLSKDKSIDWSKAYEYYQKIINMCEQADEQNQEDAGYSDVNGECEPIYLILARQAELNYHGGNGIEKDMSEAASLYSEAADKAMAYGKGRIANKYYMLAEEASAYAENEE